jgi:hypothetical protein
VGCETERDQDEKLLSVSQVSTTHQASMCMRALYTVGAQLISAFSPLPYQLLLA